MRVVAKYLALVGLPLLALVAVEYAGRGLVSPPSPTAAPGPAAARAPFDLTGLLLQMLVVLGAARASGWLFRRMGQPQVMGEMIAGILLGPSLLGWLAPSAFAALFPAGGLAGLEALSHVGVVLFMFAVGLELDTKALREHGASALVTSHVSIVAPFVLGAVLALHLYPRLAPGGVGFREFSLFLGAAMSVTAFPVLARILGERGLTRTPLGTVAIACAAVDDVTAWCILAGIVALVRSSAHDGPLWATLAGLGGYVAVMLFAVRPALARLMPADREGVTHATAAGAFLLALGSAWTTEWLGVHALFGAFLAGAVMPKRRAATTELAARVESVTVALLLPLFFALTGLRTSVALISAPGLWLDCLLVVVVAIAGKLGGTAVAAIGTGMRPRAAVALGILMNTRGLMELVILNIGLEIGVISPALFSMMVIMAVVTTLMTSPLLGLALPETRRAGRDLAAA